MGALIFTGKATAALPPGNLLANPSGLQEANVGWNITAGPLSPPAYNTGWRKDGGVGVPDSSAAFVRHGFGGKTTFRNGYFRTSYSPNPCSRFQLIDLIAKGATREELDAQPEIKVGEWISSYSANGTTPDTFFITVKLLAEDGVTELGSWTMNQTIHGSTPNAWTLFQHAFTGYGPGLRYVRFEDGGWDGGFWAGQYGSFHDESFVEITQDSDGDGLPDAIEAEYGNGGDVDPDGDLDEDGLTNLEEYLYGTDMGQADTDGDGLSDGDEITNQANPFIFDTDGDGLSDGDEVNVYFTAANLSDTDNDGFSDSVEVFATPPSDPIDPDSSPGGVVVVKKYSLTENDLTDPENDGDHTTATGFNWSAIQASANGTFAGEGAYSVFDNRISGTGSKWLVGSATPWIQVKFDTLTSLTGFTLTSGNDAPERDPLVWEIQGSIEDVGSNPTKWTTIYRWDYGSPPWEAGDRGVVYQVDLPKKSLPYRWIRYQVYSIRSGTTFQLAEIEYFGEQTNADGDADGIPKLYEDYYAFLSDANAADAAADQDADGLSNLGEYIAGTDPQNPDTDGDGLPDGQEVNVYFTNPLVADTDGDGLTDGQEVNVYATNPLAQDTDGDGFSDFMEVNSVPPTDPNNALSAPYRITVLGTGYGALIGGDLTDPENDLNDNVGNVTNGGNAGSGFNWVAVYTNSAKNYFNGSSQTTGTNEGVLNLFDNKVGGGEAKWCCEAAPRFVTVEFAAPVALTHFTMASANDSLDRSPTVWEIAGSNDNVNFTTIVADTTPGSHHWTAFNQVLRFDLNQAAPPYKFIKFTVGATNAVGNPLTGSIQMSEIEFFATPAQDPVISSSGFNGSGGFDVTADKLTPGATYRLFRSTTLQNDWSPVGGAVTVAGASHTFTDAAPPAVKAFYRVQSVP